MNCINDIIEYNISHTNDSTIHYIQMCVLKILVVH